MSNQELRKQLKAIVTRDGNSHRIPELLEEELDRLEALILSHMRDGFDTVIGKDTHWATDTLVRKLAVAANMGHMGKVEYQNMLRKEQRERASKYLKGEL